MRNSDMKNKIRHFLTGSLIAVCIVCIVVFTILAVYLSRQNEQTITQLGNIYMSSMNERITKHFGSITDHRLVQMKALAEDIPPKCGNDKELMYKWLTYSGRTRGYESLGCCHADGTFEMIYGEAAEFSNATTFLKTLENGENRIAVGYNSAGKQIILICVPVSIDIPGMEDCIALVGELPISYIADTLSLEEESSLIYSFVIRQDGTFVVRNSAAVRDNYFDRVRGVYEEVDGQTPEEVHNETESGYGVWERLLHHGSARRRAATHVLLQPAELRVVSGDPDALWRAERVGGEHGSPFPWRCCHRLRGGLASAAGGVPTVFQLKPDADEGTGGSQTGG